MIFSFSPPNIRLTPQNGVFTFSHRYVDSFFFLYSFVFLSLVLIANVGRMKLDPSFFSCPCGVRRIRELIFSSLKYNTFFRRISMRRLVTKI